MHMHYYEFETERLYYNDFLIFFFSDEMVRENLGTTGR